MLIDTNYRSTYKYMYVPRTDLYLLQKCAKNAEIVIYIPVDRGIRRTTWTTCTTDRTTAGGCRSDGCENGGAFQRRSGSSIAGYERHLQALEGRVVAEGYA